MPWRVGFDATLADIRGVAGWLSDAQAQRLWARAAELVAPARIVEIGSFQGRSTIVLARAAAPGVEIVAIDPHAGNDRGPQEIAGFEEAAATDNVVFNENLERAGVRDRVTHVRKLSSDAHGDVADPIDLLYIDGAHRFAPARDDIVQWGARVRPGGTMLIHDSFSSIGVTGAIAATLATSRDWRYVGRSGSLTEYRREAPTSVAANAGRQAAQLPWFAKNVVLKALIAAKVIKRDWPY
jgi:predicted O-methyltransferase YrrM